VPLWLNRVRLRYAGSRHQTGVALTVVVNSLLVIGIWAVATFMTSRHYVRLDLTGSKHYALAPQTRKILEELKTPVDVYMAMHRSTDLRQEIEDLLSEYASRSAQFNVHRVDPLKDPGRRSARATSSLQPFPTNCCSWWATARAACPSSR
jgi:hypothetical protein